jgi:hypothetical protein
MCRDLGTSAQNTKSINIFREVIHIWQWQPIPLCRFMVARHTVMPFHGGTPYRYAVSWWHAIPLCRFTVARHTVMPFHGGTPYRYAVSRWQPIPLCRFMVARHTVMPFHGGSPYRYAVSWWQPIPSCCYTRLPSQHTQSISQQTYEPSTSFGKQACRHHQEASLYTNGRCLLDCKVLTSPLVPEHVQLLPNTVDTQMSMLIIHKYSLWSVKIVRLKKSI